MNNNEIAGSMKFCFRRPCLQHGIHLYSLLHVLSVVQHCTALYYARSLTTCWWLQCRFLHS